MLASRIPPDPELSQSVPHPQVLLVTLGLTAKADLPMGYQIILRGTMWAAPRTGGAGFSSCGFAFHCPLKADKMSTHQEKQDLLEAGEKKTMMKKMMVREPYAGLWHWWGTKSDSSPVQLLMGPGAGGGGGEEE